jgi:hypothetical protein
MFAYFFKSIFSNKLDSNKTARSIMKAKGKKVYDASYLHSPFCLTVILPSVVVLNVVAPSIELQWVETNPSNIRICPMDVRFAT